MSYKLWKKKTSGPILEWKRALVRMNYHGQNGCHFSKLLHAKILWRNGMHDLLPVHDTVCMIYCRSMTRYVWCIAGPWHGMYDLLPVHDTVCMIYCRSMIRYVWFIARPWHGMYDLLPVHDTVCMIYCPSMTRYVWFIAGPWHGMYDLLLGSNTCNCLGTILIVHCAPLCACYINFLRVLSKTR